jgi:hypothetical protein
MKCYGKLKKSDLKEAHLMLNKANTIQKHHGPKSHNPNLKWDPRFS